MVPRTTPLHLWIFAVFTLIASSCSLNEPPTLQEEGHGNDDLSLAMDLIQNFRNGLGQMNPIKITGLTNERIALSTLADIKPISSRASDSYVTTQTVKYLNGSNEGFAVIGEYAGNRQIYFITDNGSIEESADIPPLTEYLKEIPQIAVKSAQYKAELLKAPGFSNDSNLAWIYNEPLVKTEWGQGVPYNKFAPICTDGDWGDVPHSDHNYHISCVAIAVGQFLANQNYFYSTADNYMYALGAFTKTPKPNAEQEDNVARFLIDLSNRLKISYVSCYLSTGSTLDMTNLLRKFGYNVSVKINLNISEFHKFIVNGTPIITFGCRANSSVGHVWLMDGIYGPKYEPYYHCNWGWDGKCNGWVLGSPLYPLGHEDQGNDGIVPYSKNARYFICE